MDFYFTDDETEAQRICVIINQQTHDLNAGMCDSKTYILKTNLGVLQHFLQSSQVFWIAYCPMNSLLIG